MILVTGSLAFDLIMDFPGKFTDNIDPQNLHILNLSFLVTKLKQERGGTAGNIAYSLALLGLKVGVLAAAGEDFTPYQKYLNDVGVDVSGIKVIKLEKTALAFIITDKSDNQITGFYPGAMQFAHKLSIKRLKTKPEFVIIAPDNPQAMSNYVRQCQNFRIPYMFDPGMQLPRLSDADLLQGISQAEILVGNDYEISLIKKRLGMDDKEILKHVKVMITTLGEKGSVAKTPNQELGVAAAKAKRVVDPTGAGDAYRAGFLAGYLRGFDLRTCAQMGSVASCYVVEKYGTNNHTFTKKEFRKRYQENFTKLPPF